MLTFLSGLVLLANVNYGAAQGPVNRPPDPPVTAPAVAVCCGATTAPEPPPPPQGTNKGLLTEPLFLTSLADAVASRSKNEDVVPKSGPYLKFGTGVSGAGWIAAGPGYRMNLGDRLLLDVSGVVSWKRYLIGRGRLELRPLANSDLTLGAQVLGQDWTQVQYFGLGQESREENRSTYRLRATDVSAYAAISPGKLFDLRVRGGVLNRPRISRASGWNKGNYPDTQSLFTNVSAPGLTEQPQFWHGDISLSRDTLDHPDHPTRGILLELAASQFDDRDFDRYNFRRYELTTVAAVPLVGNKWVLGVRGIAVASTTSDGNQVPFYMMPSLGKTTLRGFENGRFHDRNAVAFNVESRWAIFQHMDLALFGDFGGVAPRFKALDRNDFESSYGVGLRFHTGAKTFLRIDAAKPGSGGGGWKVLFKLYESLNFSKERRWNTVVPIVR